MNAPHLLAGVLVGLLVLASACGGSSSDAASTSDAAASGDTSAGSSASDDSTSGVATGIRMVTADDALTITENPPADLVILDIRTPEEFAEGHLEAATMIDFYANDFASQLGDLDPSVPYLVYCRSGNRSGQATALMADLGFVDVADVEGGILAWTASGFAVTK